MCECCWQTKRDTMDVIQEIADALGISVKKFSMAGLKDKWAVLHRLAVYLV